MSADVKALIRGKRGKFISDAKFRKRKLDLKRLDSLSLQPKVQEKGLIPAAISRQEIYIFI